MATGYPRLGLLAPLHNRRAATTAAVLVTAGVALSWWSEGIMRWLGVAVMLVGVPPLWSMAAGSAWWQARRARLPIAMFVALVVVVLGPLLMGEPPASRDHGIHYFQIRMLVEELLPTGRLWGWSETLNNGYPYGESYPVLGYLWMAAAHLVTFGGISLRTSYAWGLASLWIGSALVVWWLSASVTRELASRLRPAAAEQPDSTPDERITEIARWAGLVGATAWLLDPGASRQGGWNYLMFHGVWPQLMAATLWAASLGLTWRAMARPTVRRIALATLVLGASLWAHPFALLTITISAAGLIGVVLAVPAAQRWPAPWRTFALVHMGAAMIGAAWIATFFAAADSMARAPVPWTPLADLGRAAVHGQLLAGQWAWVGPLAAIGAIAVVARGSAKGWLLVSVAIATVVLASEEAITILRLDLVMSGFKNLQFPRYAIPLKPLWFGLTGVGVGAIILRLRDRAPVAMPSWTPSSWVGRVAAALVLAPLLATLAPGLGRLLPRPIAAIDTLTNAELADHERSLLDALNAEREALPSDRPLVVAMMREDMSGATYPIATVADAGGRLVLDSHIPTVNFKHRVRRNAQSYAALGVTHVLHDRDVPEDEGRLLIALEKVGRYGPFTLERFTPPQGHTDAIVRVQGGDVDLRVEQPHRIEFDVTGTSGPSTVLFRRAPHTRWELTLDGEPLEIEPRSLHQRGIVAMAATLDHPGHVVLHYAISERERQAMWISMIAIVLALLGLASGRAIATRAPSARAVMIGQIAFVLLAVLVVIALVRRQAEQLDLTWRTLAHGVLDGPSDSTDENDLGDSVFIRDLVLDDALIVERDPQTACSGLLGKNVLEGCSEAAHAPSVSFLYRDPYLYRCLRFSLPPRGHVDIELPSLPDSDHVVVGTVIRHVRPGTGKAVRWGIGKKARGALRNRRHDFMIPPGADTTMPPLRFRNDGNAIEQVCVALAQVQR